MSAVPPRPLRRTARWRDTVLGALLAALERPRLWVVCLLGFLVRGGLFLFLLPIVVLPTPAGIQAELAPLLVPLVFGQVSPGLGLLTVALLAVGAASLVLGGLVGAWMDALAGREAAADAAPEAAGIAAASDVVEAAPDTAAPAADGRVVGAVCTARLLAHAPLAVALAWCAPRVATTVHAELVTPFEVATPIAVRIATALPDAITVVLVAWLLGEAAGGLAAREIVIRRRSAIRGALLGWLDLLRHPVASAATIVVGTAAVTLAVAPALVAAAAAWGSARSLLFEGAPPAHVALALAGFVTLWLGGLVLAGLATAFRAVAWTEEWLRHRPATVLGDAVGSAGGTGTIGDRSTDRRAGWPARGTADTLEAPQRRS